jgi:hypothetical protein
MSVIVTSRLENLMAFLEAENPRSGLAVLYDEIGNIFSESVNF